MSRVKIYPVFDGWLPPVKVMPCFPICARLPAILSAIPPENRWWPRIRSGMMNLVFYDFIFSVQLLRSALFQIAWVSKPITPQDQVALDCKLGLNCGDDLIQIG
jgi:hypothetical protein